MATRPLKRRALLIGVPVALAFVLALVLLWQGSRAPPRELVLGGNSPPAPRVPPETEQLDAAVLESAADYAAAHGSLALIVSRHDHIVFERYWHGTSFDTVEDAQSFTPLLAALAAGAAFSHRLIGWPDQPVGAFIGEWSHDPRGEITVRNLLQMSSGLAADGARRGSGDLTAQLLHTPLARTPGVSRTEQATDPQLLALVLERATQQRYASYLSQALWRRIGAGDASLTLDRPQGAAHADCCMLAHQGDWIRIGQLLLRDGNYRGDEVIRPGWVTLMRSPAQSDPQYGAYVRVRWPAAPGRELPAARDLYAVEGQGGNRLWLLPSLQIAILCTGPAGGRDSGWDDNRLPSLVVRAARDALPPAAQPGVDISAIVSGH
ncbi:MAG: serine hydrolase [Gammaproteobacteria bacterium]|nr:serine hydrolase [Gammaproteobacteria bacterium]MBV9315891.1 serine hydrolase [Gammaproteobacteria bacterium]